MSLQHNDDAFPRTPPPPPLTVANDIDVSDVRIDIDFKEESNIVGEVTNFDNYRVINLPALEGFPQLSFVCPLSEAQRNRSVLLILPGGGYRKCMTTKEGEKIGGAFAKDGFCSLVLTYAIGKRGFLKNRAKNVWPIIEQAIKSLQFLRDSCADGR